MIEFLERLRLWRVQEVTLRRILDYIDCVRPMCEARDKGTRRTGCDAAISRARMESPRITCSRKISAGVGLAGFSGQRIDHETGRSSLRGVGMALLFTSALLFENDNQFCGLYLSNSTRYPDLFGEVSPQTLGKIRV